MKDVLQKLILAPKPKFDESMVGYVLRLAEMNGYQNPAWILELSNLTSSQFRSPNKWAFVFNDKSDLSRLAQFTGRNESELRLLTYPSASTDSPVYERLIFGLPISTYAIRPTHPKVCPRCLSEDPYCRRIWELTLVTVCPTHKCLLLDECPQCGARITSNRKRVSVCQCKFDWSGASVSIVKESELAVTRQIHRLCGLSTSEGSSEHILENNPLFKLDLAHFVSALFFIAGHSEGVTDSTGKYLSISRRNQELNRLMHDALCVFDDWPKPYQQFIDRIRKTEHESECMTGVKKEFGPFYRGLYRHLSSKHFDFMRTAFEHYLSTHWDGGYAVNVHRYKPSKVRSRKYIGITEATQRLKAEHSWVNKFIEEGKLKAVVRNLKAKRMLLIDLESVETLKADLERGLSLSEVADLLMVGEDSVKNLMDDGYLKPLRGPTLDGFSHWRVDQETVNQLLDQLSSQIVSSTASDKVSLDVAVSMLFSHKFTIGRFIRAVLNGEIHPCGETAEAGLTRFQFSAAQILSYNSTLWLIRRRGSMSLKKAAKELKMSDKVVALLAHRGILPTEKVLELGRPVMLVSKDAFTFFESTYISLAQLSQRLDVSSRNLFKFLIRKRVQPISGPMIDGNDQYVFRKSDLEALNLTARFRSPFTQLDLFSMAEAA